MVREQQGPASRRARGRRAWLGATLRVAVIASLLVAGAGCGSRSLLLMPYGDDGGAPGPLPGDDAGGGGGSSSSGGGSSSSSGGSVSYGDAGGGSSSADAGAFVGNAICSSAADCPAGRICCATENLVTSCLEGPCPAVAPLQFCATATECVVKGDACIFLLTEPEDSYMVCTPPQASSR